MKKNSIFMISTIIMIITSCNIENNIQFSFKKIQDFYYKQLSFPKTNHCDPFYVSEDFFQSVEQKLNQLIKESKYCSVLIKSSIDNGLCEVAALYDCKNEVYCYNWTENQERQEKIHDSKALKILKSKPKELMIFNESNLPIFDGITIYVIKKINNKTYYYANYEGPIDGNYAALIDLFNRNL